MTKSTLMQRVNAHTTGQRTSGQNTLALTVECIDHMFGASGDWSPLASLIGGSEPAQSRMVRAIVGKTVQGYTLSKDETQKSGLRFKLKKGANKGVDETYMDKLRVFVEAKKSIQSTDVKDLVKAAPKPVDKSKAAEAVQKYAKTFCEKFGVTKAQMIAMLQAKPSDVTSVTVAAASQPATPLVSVIPSTRPVDPDAHIAH